MSKIALIVQGIIVTEYPNEPQYYAEVIEDCKTALEETGQLHEIMIVD